MSGRMVASFLIRSLVPLPPMLGSSLINQRITRVDVGGVMLIMFVLRGVFSLEGFLLRSWALQSVQRAELWGVILALQSSGAVHLGVDNLGVGSSCWASA